MWTAPLPDRPSSASSSSSSELCSIFCMADCLSNWYAFVSVERHTRKVDVKYLLKSQVSNFQRFLCLMRQHAPVAESFGPDAENTGLNQLSCWFKPTACSNCFHETAISISHYLSIPSQEDNDLFSALKTLVITFQNTKVGIISERSRETVLAKINKEEVHNQWAVVSMIWIKQQSESKDRRKLHNQVPAFLTSCLRLKILLLIIF